MEDILEMGYPESWIMDSKVNYGALRWTRRDAIIMDYIGDRGCPSPQITNNHVPLSVASFLVK